MRLERIQLVIDDTSRTQRHETSQSLANHQRVVENTLDQLLETHLGRNRILANEPYDALLRSSNDPDVATPRTNEPLEPSPSARNYTNDIMSQTFRFSTSYQELCKPSCRCRCHLRQRWKSPPMLDRFLGTVFLGYVGLPIMYPRCDFHACLRQRSFIVSFTYYFPAWFLLRILHIQIRHRQNLGPEQLLRVSRRVSDYSEILKFARKGNVEGIKSVLKDGLGSPFDIGIQSSFSPMNVRYT